jgi:hypothetical protein
MMRINKSTGLFLLTLLVMISIISCQTGERNNSKNPNADKTTPKNDSFSLLEQEVMAVHNETMKGMDSLMFLKAELKKVPNDKTLSGIERDSVNNNIKNLENAMNAMMDWMHQYKKPANKQDTAASMMYLHAQRQKIENVKLQMEESKYRASALLKKIKN